MDFSFFRLRLLRFFKKILLNWVIKNVIINNSYDYSMLKRKDKNIEFL